MRRVSLKRQRQRRTEEGRAYDRMLQETDKPWCWNCGRDENDSPPDWFAKWQIQRAHLAAGGSKMLRQEDRRAVVLLCPFCHSLHTTNGDTAKRINSVIYPTLSNSNVMWLKLVRDLGWYDEEYIKRVWIGIPPEPIEPPAMYLREYQTRRMVSHGQPKPT